MPTPHGVVEHHDLPSIARPSSPDEGSLHDFRTSGQWLVLSDKERACGGGGFPALTAELPATLGMRCRFRRGGGEQQELVHDGDQGHVSRACRTWSPRGTCGRGRVCAGLARLSPCREGGTPGSAPALDEALALLLIGLVRPEVPCRTDGRLWRRQLPIEGLRVFAEPQGFAGVQQVVGGGVGEPIPYPSGFARAAGAEQERGASGCGE